MDSAAYLRKHGWQGTGHSLDAHSQNRGLKKPLLISKKVDVLGIGIRKHDVSDQWWMRAFDSSLKDLGTEKKELSALASVRLHGVNRGGLYARFVRGEGVPGTLQEPSSSPSEKNAKHGRQGASGAALDGKQDIEPTEAESSSDDCSDGTSDGSGTDGDEDDDDTSATEPSSASELRETSIGGKKRKAPISDDDNDGLKRARVGEKAIPQVDGRSNGDGERSSKRRSHAAASNGVQRDAKKEVVEAARGTKGSTTKEARKLARRQERDDKDSTQRSIDQSADTTSHAQQKHESVEDSEREAVDKRHAAECGLSYAAFQSLPPTSHKKLQRMHKKLKVEDASKVKRYKKRAAEKNMSLEQYYYTRTLKNEQAARGKKQG